mmetsp:Transcript_17180/g.35955  ORF Transcript_17180/g.35955 Transcript_17180/m.35955 type:complete len:418 (-) Transcript_17180:241-1494(-)
MASKHIVKLLDGSTHHYRLRGLNENDEDIAKWTKFCASVFSYKPNPPSPSYFARHFYNDPRHDANLVRVLTYRPDNNASSQEEDSIVSSVRIFQRTISMGPRHPPIETGGIGEVCTSPDHQRRGLSKVLLQDALKIIRDSSSRVGLEAMSCSSLHASPTFQPVYSKVGGYKSVVSQWSLVPIRLQYFFSSESTGNQSAFMRQAQFPKDTPQLMKLHQIFSEQRFAGCIIRSETYWNDYVSAELGDTLWVMTTTSSSYHEDDSKNEDSEERIVGWISIRKRGGRYQLREFGADISADERDKETGEAKVTLKKPINMAFVMKELLSKALSQAGETVEGDEGSAVSLHLPTVVWNEIKRDASILDSCHQIYFDFDGAQVDDDDGWMYVVFDESKEQTNVFDSTMRNEDPVPHLVWPTDSF